MGLDARILMCPPTAPRPRLVRGVRSRRQIGVRLGYVFFPGRYAVMVESDGGSRPGGRNKRRLYRVQRLGKDADGERVRQGEFLGLR
jgi:hypothetical protein